MLLQLRISPDFLIQFPFSFRFCPSLIILAFVTYEWGSAMTFPSLGVAVRTFTRKYKIASNFGVVEELMATAWAFVQAAVEHYTTGKC